MQGLKVLQCNLGRERLAHEVAHATLIEGDYDLMVVGEPNLKMATKCGWVLDKTKVVAVYFRNKKIRVESLRREDGWVEIRMPGLTIVAGYVSPNISLERYEQALSNMLDGLRSGDKFIVLGDLNAKSPLWGSPKLDKRGETLGEWVETLDLVVLNRGNEPTFVRGNTRSFIDVSLASSGAAPYVEGWRVLDKDSATLHRYIAFKVRGTRPKGGAGAPRAKNWDAFRNAMNIKARTWREEELTEKGLMKAVGEAYRGCLEPKSRREGGGKPYWWNDAIETTRQAMTRTRRELTRARRHLGDQGSNDVVDRLQEEYRNWKVTLSKEISRSKATHWDRLCRELEENPWGDAYRIVTKTLGVRPYELTLERKKDEARLLFPVVHEPQPERREPAEAPPFTQQELREAVQNFKKGKAPGPDGIPPEAIIELYKAEEEWLLLILNKLLVQQSFPRTWKEAKLVLIPKGGGAGDKVRPICLLNTINKLYETLIKNRLEAEIKEKGGLSTRQFGFRKGLSTINAVREAVGNSSRGGGWAAMITLDVKNAFNTVRWDHIREELAKKGISQYLQNVIGDYLSNRRLEIEKGEWMDVSAGVPQGSVLGPTLWNLAYDGVLRLKWPKGVKVVGFADDLGVVGEADNEATLVQNINAAVKMVDEWTREKGLELAPHKTEAVMLRGPRKKSKTIFRARDVAICHQKAIKYLGVWVDDQGTFGRHVIESIAKAARRTAALGRILPNIGGPTEPKRRVMYEVVASTLLYAAPVWAAALRIGRYHQMLEAAQRRALLRVGMAYRTVSAPAIQVVTGIVPITLLVEERVRLFEREDKSTRQAKEEEREKTLDAWQRRWAEEAERGQWTKTLIPDIRTWVKCPHRRLNFYVTQALTGHGSFKTFTCKIKKTEDNRCRYCERQDTPAHTLFECQRWADERSELEREIGVRLCEGNMVSQMIKKEDKWRDISNYIRRVMEQKAVDERADETVA